MASRTTAILIVILGTIVGITTAQAKLQICKGDFALCDATACTPTGGTIAINNNKGSYPAASCTCPILRGPAIADTAGGNMKGSCAPPDTPGGIWSLYSPRRHIPQAITNWSRRPSESKAPILRCPASLNLGAKMVNCFSFACTEIKPIRGVRRAQCVCPIGVGLNNTTQPPDTAFGTKAGQGDQNYCSMYPVSTAVPQRGE
jgi:hypothetical protein